MSTLTIWLVSAAVALVCIWAVAVFRYIPKKIREQVKGNYHLLGNAEFGYGKPRHIEFIMTLRNIKDNEKSFQLAKNDSLHGFRFDAWIGKFCSKIAAGRCFLKVFPLPDKNYDGYGFDSWISNLIDLGHKASEMLLKMGVESLADYEISTKFVLRIFDEKTREIKSESDFLDPLIRKICGRALEKKLKEFNFWSCFWVEHNKHPQEYWDDLEKQQAREIVITKIKGPRNMKLAIEALKNLS